MKNAPTTPILARNSRAVCTAIAHAMTPGFSVDRADMLNARAKLSAYLDLPAGHTLEQEIGAWVNFEWMISSVTSSPKAIREHARKMERVSLILNAYAEGGAKAVRALRF